MLFDLLQLGQRRTAQKNLVVSNGLLEMLRVLSLQSGQRNLVNGFAERGQAVISPLLVHLDVLQPFYNPGHRIREQLPRMKLGGLNVSHAAKRWRQVGRERQLHIGGTDKNQVYALFQNVFQLIPDPVPFPCTTVQGSFRHQEDRVLRFVYRLVEPFVELTVSQLLHVEKDPQSSQLQRLFQISGLFSARAPITDEHVVCLLRCAFLLAQFSVFHRCLALPILICQALAGATPVARPGAGGSSFRRAVV